MRQLDDVQTTTAAEPLWEINWRGKLHTFTEAQLNAQPHLWKYARPVQSGDVLTFDTDFADDPRPGRLPSSSRRYYMPDVQGRQTRIEERSYTVPDYTSTPRKRAHAAAETENVPRKGKKQKRSFFRFLKGYPKVSIVLGMAIMALLAFTVSSLLSWWTMHRQDVTYGRPRTFQLDAVVGHNDSPTNPSHFLFLNLNRHVLIIELPGGDTSKARIYNGPTLFGDGQELTPVTAEFKDVNGDGRPDMVVHIQDQTLVYLNDGTQFVPLKPGQQVNLGS